MKIVRVFACSLLVLSLTACSKWWEEKEDYNPYEGLSAKQLFTEGQAALRKEQYTEAAKKFEAMETMYPFSEYTEQAELDLIYAYYKAEDYPSAAATAERFIHLYPRARKVDYAYYMKGMANFQQSRGVFAKILPLDESWRDPGTQFKAYSDFAEVVQKFPNSKYKPDAAQRMIYLRNMFAQRLLNTAEYYYERKMYVAASERASEVVKNYPQAPATKKALVILRNANLAMGLYNAADDAEKVYMASYGQKMERVR